MTGGPFQKMAGSRLSVFEELEQPALPCRRRSAGDDTPTNRSALLDQAGVHVKLASRAPEVEPATGGRQGEEDRVERGRAGRPTVVEEARATGHAWGSFGSLERWGEDRLDAAYQRAITFSAYSYKSVKTIL